ncbi:MAG TPA: hypothetical protein VF791_09930 [Pyrinomonadaceae bacterium]
MNNLAYTSHKIEVIGPKVEEKIREELGAPAPLPYQVEDGNAGEMSAGKFFSDIAGGLLGGKADVLFNLHFDLTHPRPTHLQVSMNRQGVGSHAGVLLYSTWLSKPVAGEVWLEDPKTFGKSKFKGDPAASERLNANGDLIKRANNFARTESQSGGLNLKIKRLCKIMPQQNGTMLLIATLPRPTKMGFSAAVDAAEFFDIASMIEATL